MYHSMHGLSQMDVFKRKKVYSDESQSICNIMPSIITMTMDYFVQSPVC